MKTTRYNSITLAASLLFGCGVASGQARQWHLPDNAPLLTRWAKDVSPANALPEYPRPQMVRERWQNLNGLWDYAVTAKNQESVPEKFDGKILVPYPIESALSGVMKPFLPKDRLWYRRTFTLSEAWRGQRVLLHFRRSRLGSRRICQRPRPRRPPWRL